MDQIDNDDDFSEGQCTACLDYKLNTFTIIGGDGGGQAITTFIDNVDIPPGHGFRLQFVSSLASP